MHHIKDSFKSLKTLKVGSKSYSFYSLKAAESNGLEGIRRLPYSLKVLLENLLRYEDGKVVTDSDVKAMKAWLKDKTSTYEIAFHPARVLMQDFTGVPAVVDLAAMREAMQTLDGDPKKINPLSPVDLVIDHSVNVDQFGSKDAFQGNVDLEFERNHERYVLLHWAQQAFNNFRVVPPGTGICHQVNLEYLAKVIWHAQKDGKLWAYPDTLVGTDSHTTMINGLAVLGWGVGGIEAEAAMLEQPVTMVIPDVIGFKLSGSLKEGVTATDLVLTVTEMLRKKGVVGKFVEFFGPGLEHLPLADRATIANMAPEYGATCGIFPIDSETVNFLKFTGRSPEEVELVEAYAKEQGLWRDKKSEDPVFTDVLELDLGKVEPCVAGPKRPQDRIVLSKASSEFKKILKDGYKLSAQDIEKSVKVAGSDYELKSGSVVIAAITSCTNTSNPSVMLAAGLVAKKAVEKGLKTKPWVKTSLAPGSQVVTDYLIESGLQSYLDKLGFNLVGYGCTTCIGNSGPLSDPISQAIQKNGLVACAVLSGNRNFEGRISPDCKANYLASPPLVVAFALAGSVNIDLTKDPIGNDTKGKPVYFKDIWPTNDEIKATLSKALSPEMYRSRYKDVFKGPEQWRSIKSPKGFAFVWDKDSTYIKRPPFFDDMELKPQELTDIEEARPLAILGDSVTTDHISPAGAIKEDSPAGKYLKQHKVEKKMFNSYGSRRGNHEVMMRGTFANIRIKNEMTPGVEGGVTNYMPDNELMTIYDAAIKYQEHNVPLVIVAGKEYGTGSSRDWAAKGTFLLGVRAVIAESFERIHRSNLIGMRVLPLEFKNGENRQTLKLTGKEVFSITGVKKLKPRSELKCTIQDEKGKEKTISVLCRIDTEDELNYYLNGGILNYVLRKLV